MSAAKELGEQPVAPTFASVGDKSLSKGGLTKREHFASIAMQGLLMHYGDYAFKRVQGQTYLQEAAVDYADGLLAELAKDQP